MRINVADRQVYWHTNTKKRQKDVCRTGCHKPTDGHVMVGNSVHEYDRWAEMEKSRLYVFYGLCNCIISYCILEIIIDTERYVDLLCDTTSCFYFRTNEQRTITLGVMDTN